MPVVITGAGGQLGADLLTAFGGDEPVGLTHAQLDVSDETAVVAALRDLDPDLVVHAGAFTDVDGCESDPDRAHRVNALGAWWVARACRLVRAPMVFVSTDYVFEGTAPRRADGRRRGWTEFDPLDPINAYGRSKAAGERLVRQTLREHYIVRTAWLCGARGSNFVKTMLQLGRERGSLRVVDDQIGCPTFTADLAGAIRELAVTGRYGTYHRTNTGRCSWFDLAAAVFELSGIDVEVSPQSSDELDRAAPRPAWSVLSDRHSRLSGLSPLPRWRTGLERLLGEIPGPAPGGPS